MPPKNSNSARRNAPSKQASVPDTQRIPKTPSHSDSGSDDEDVEVSSKRSVPVDSVITESPCKRRAVSPQVLDLGATKDAVFEMDKATGTVTINHSKFFFFKGFLPIGANARLFGARTFGDFEVLPSAGILSAVQTLSDNMKEYLKRLHDQGNYGNDAFKASPFMFSAPVTRNGTIKLRYSLGQFSVKRYDNSDISSTSAHVEPKEIVNSIDNSKHEVLSTFITAQTYTMKNQSSYGTTCGLVLKVQQIFLRPITLETQQRMEEHLQAQQSFSPAASAAQFM
jgi:hypothetical protein